MIPTKASVQKSSGTHLGTLCIFVVLSLSFTQARAASAARGGAGVQGGESITVSLDVSGDVSGNFDFSGPLGSEIEGQEVAQAKKSTCQMEAQFRRALYRQKNSLEVWLNLKCTEEGQKKSYRPSRFFIDPALDENEIQLPILDRQLKKLYLKFHDLSLKKGK
jgi:hypothetical protein